MLNISYVVVKNVTWVHFVDSGQNFPSLALSGELLSFVSGAKYDTISREKMCVSKEIFKEQFH